MKPTCSRGAVWFAVVVLGLWGVPAAGNEVGRPNVLIITVDDMSADSVGAFGAKLAETTPTIDQLATEGLRFQHAHVQVGNCMPSRNVLFSGLYSHNNHVEGFYQVRSIDYPVMAQVLHDAGYFTGIRGKVNHSTPYQPFSWDADLGQLPGQPAAHIKDPASYGQSTAHGIRLAKQADKPFCLVINVSDPHKPFYAEGRNGQTIDDPHIPSRVFMPDEVPVPGFLPDDPVVRKELAHYYSSVRRADDCVREVLAALDMAQQREETLVVFLSDHGMPLPFAKTQLYHHSTRTPWIFRWPGRIASNEVDSEHMISAVDFFPTLLEVLDIPAPAQFDGRSFAPVLFADPQSAAQRGAQAGRDFVIKEYNENAGGNRSPMRAIETKEFLYIFNPWSDGKRIMKTATQGTSTFRRMRQLAQTDPAIAARVDLIQHRVLEELYDVQSDPDCLHNLAGDRAYQETLSQLRNQLLASMKQSRDPLVELLLQRDDAELLSAEVDRQQAEAERRKGRAKRQSIQETKR